LNCEHGGERFIICLLGHIERWIKKTSNKLAKAVKSVVASNENQRLQLCSVSLKFVRRVDSMIAICELNCEHGGDWRDGMVVTTNELKSKHRRSIKYPLIDRKTVSKWEANTGL